MVVSAKKLHADLYAEFGHFDHYIEQATGGKEDTRWSGRLGEIVVDEYLTQLGLPHEWDPIGQPFGPDFVIQGTKADLKTKSCGSPPVMGPSYFATVRMEQYLRAPAKGIQCYLFCNYNHNNQTMYLVGSASVERFEEWKIHRIVGDQIHSKYTVREESYDIHLSKLISPRDWS